MQFGERLNLPGGFCLVDDAFGLVKCGGNFESTFLLGFKGHFIVFNFTPRRDT